MPMPAPAAVTELTPPSALDLPESRALGDPGTAKVVEDFERFAGSYFVALFAAALFDQVALPTVAAGVEWTGRIRYTPFERAVRTAAADQLVVLAPEADSKVEMERLVRLHRDVKGTSPDGVRFSALHPESWNWVLLSTFFMYRGAFEAVSGQKLTDDGNQAVWDFIRTRMAGLEYPDPRFALSRSYSEIAEYYEMMAADKCRRTDTLCDVVTLARRPAPPPPLPRVAKPLWNLLVAPIAGRVLTTSGFGIMHPQVRQLAGIEWGRRERLEFAALSRVLRVAYARLPERLVLTPLAYHRRKVEELVRRYSDVGLASFAPDIR
jgi:uncharacterized protein (DUF2236 family)